MDNQSKILAEKISSKLAKAGETSEVIEIDRAAQSGDANAQYQKACQLLGRQDCKLPIKDEINPREWSLRDKLESDISTALWAFSSSASSDGEWFKWLLKSAKAGHKKALEDILYLIEWPPFIQDPQLFFEACILAASYDDLNYIDQFGDEQPYALKVAQMYWTGRVHIPTAKDWAEIRRYSSTWDYSFFDSRLDSSSGEGLPLKSKNIIGESPLKSVVYFNRAVALGSLFAMDRLCNILLFGGCFSNSKEKIEPNIKKALELYLKLESRGGYAMPHYYYDEQGKFAVLKNANRFTDPCHIAGIYLYGAPGVEKNLEIAVDRYTKCVDLGYKEAESQLRHILDHIQTKKPLPPVPKGYPPEIGKHGVSNFLGRLFG